MAVDLGDDDVRVAVVVAATLAVALPLALYQWLGAGAVLAYSAVATGLLAVAVVALSLQRAERVDGHASPADRPPRSALSKLGTAVAEGDEVRVRLRNAGAGTVRRLYLVSEVTAPASIELAPGRVTMVDVEGGGVDLPPGSGYRTFAGEVRIRVPDREPEARPFREVARLLSAEGVETVRLELAVEVVDAGDAVGYVVEIADQELALAPPAVDGEGRTAPRPTTVEEAIEYPFSTAQDVNQEPWEWAARGQSTPGGE